MIDDYDVRLIAPTTRIDHHDGEIDGERLEWLERTLAAT